MFFFKNGSLLIKAIEIAAISVLVVGAVYLIAKICPFAPGKSDQKQDLDPPDVTSPLPPSDSPLGNFSRAAIAVNSHPCADIAKDILERGGNAVDATIAALLCDGVCMPQSTGIGAGFFMVIYNRENRKTYTINARETAPGAATTDMFQKDPNLSQLGGMAVAIPGQVKGLWTAYQEFGGGLPWKELVEPTIKLCEEGIPVNKHLKKSLKGKRVALNKFPDLNRLFIDDVTGDQVDIGGTYKNPQLAKTLRIVAEDGGDALYNGSLAKLLVDDIKETGGIITLEDLANYRVRIEEPLITPIFDGLTLHTTNPPSSGILLSYILRTVSGIIPSQNNITDIQRITEAFKFAYGARSRLGDPFFANITKIANDLLSENFIRLTRSKIKDNVTFSDFEYYDGHFEFVEDHGTAHLSILAENGDAVSVTSTINLWFGSKVCSKSTGIILNNEMDDFSIPTSVNAYKIPPSESNFIKPYKRPMSSMCPSIITDESGDVRMVVGASGGSRITTSVSLTTIRSLLYDMNLKEAVDAPMFHHQLMPMKWYYWYGTLKSTVDGMKKIGHTVTRSSDTTLACINVIQKKNGRVYAHNDYRRQGSMAGY